MDPGWVDVFPIEIGDSLFCAENQLPKIMKMIKIHPAQLGLGPRWWELFFG